MNMSYCRFHNTRLDLMDCIETVRQHLNDEGAYEVSKDEIEEFFEIVHEFVDFLNDTDILNECGVIDDDVLKDIGEQMAIAEYQEDW